MAEWGAAWCGDDQNPPPPQHCRHTTQVAWSVVIRVPGQDAQRPVELLCQHHPGELVRQGSCEAPKAAKSGPVAVTQIAVATLCPHHLLPALGVAHVVYLPGAKLLGIGTISALVDACARRLTLQEAIGQDVVAALMEHAGARGAYCELELEHSCLRARGERQAAALVRSSARAGEFAHPGALTEIALALGHTRSAP